MNYITVLYLRFLLCLPVLLGHEDTDLLDQHYHDYQQCNGRKENVFLVAVVAVLQGNRTKSAASDNTCHRRVSQYGCHIDRTALKK